MGRYGHCKGILFLGGLGSHVLPPFTWSRKGEWLLRCDVRFKDTCVEQ